MGLDTRSDGILLDAMDRTEDPRYSFDAAPAVEELIEQQGKGPLADPTVLLGNFWPEDEPVEEFLAALREWRGHSQSDRVA